MARIADLIRVALASFAIKIFLNSVYRDELVGSTGTISEVNLENSEIKNKKVIIKRKLRRPIYYKKIQVYYRHRLKYYSTKSRNVRDLDQRKIRRKCTNL